MKRIFTLFIITLFITPLFSQTGRTVIIEHFTNTYCGACSFLNPGFYQTLENYPDVVHIAYHPSSPYPSCVFNQHNPTENDGRTEFYGVYGSTPRVVIQGEAIQAQNPMVNPEQIDAQLGGTSDYALSTTKTELSANNFKITIEIERVSGSVNETILVYAGLAEKEIEYNAPNGEDVHYDVFRKVVFFDTVSINTIGQKKTLEYEYSTDAAWDENQIYAFAIIHDATTKMVKQSATSLESPAGVGDKTFNELNHILYPNPTTNIIKVKSEYTEIFSSFELFDLVGNKVKELRNTNEMDIAELPEGVYFVRLTDQNGRTYSSKILKASH